MRKPIIVGNWKMNKTIAEAVEFIKAVDPVCHENATYGIATSFLALQESVKNANNLIVAAENCHLKTVVHLPEKSLYQCWKKSV